MKKSLPRSLSSFGVDDEKELLRRAFRAWFRSGEIDQPSNASAVEVHGDDWYVVLRGGRGPAGEPAGVYRLRNDGTLRRLRRWPASIEG